ncbi:MAG: 3-isopropylmalate dehydratase [Lentisphaerae bacterium]|nr:3-isopropylmalate dehydratase [Lentisphaerota bacterium]
MTSKKTLAQAIRGTVYVVGDNIDTDQIIPAQYLNLVPTIPGEYEKLGAHALSGLPAGCAPFVRAGSARSAHSILVGGRNFGCGSSREHAPVALGAAGVQAVVAQSYARIFFRNCVATGELYPCETDERLCDVFKTGDEAEIDLSANAIIRLSDGRRFALKPMGDAAPVIQAGGLFKFARKAGMIKS